MSDRPVRSHTRLLRLFPRAWRARYEQEFLALIEDRPPGLRDTVDIILSAIDARIRPQAWAVQSEREGQLVLQASAGPPVPGQTITVGGRRSEQQDASRRFTRRQFLRNAVLGGVGVVAVATTAGAISFAQPNKTGVFGKEVLVPKESIPPAGAPPYKHLQGKFWLINNQDGALALYWKCPHLGCTVPWNEGEGQFHCPCHHSIYNRHGVRIDGPAPRPMDLMQMSADRNGDLVVDTGEVIQREDYDPSQAVKIDPS